MKLMKFATAALLPLALGLTACQGGPEGAYKLDKAEMKKAMEAEIAKMPEEQKAFAGLAIAMIDAMDMSLEIKSGGDLEMKATMPSLKEGEASKTETKTGKWKKDGEKYVLDMDGKSTSCTLADKKLTCASEKKGEPSLVFIKG